MIELSLEDIDAMLIAIEYYIISIEEHLIATNAGDVEWGKLEPQRKALNNLKFLQSTYGKQKAQV